VGVASANPTVVADRHGGEQVRGDGSGVKVAARTAANLPGNRQSGDVTTLGEKGKTGAILGKRFGIGETTVRKAVTLPKPRAGRRRNGEPTAPYPSFAEQNRLLRAELAKLRAELDALTAALEQARTERDEARAQRQRLIVRVEELERQVAERSGRS
jgi:hypothetical protein